MTDSTEMKSLSVLAWDGKAELCPRYIAQIKALAEHYNCGNALNATKMAKCLTKREFDALETTDLNYIAQVKLYKANKNVCNTHPWAK